jgi:hypothetical protein
MTTNLVNPQTRSSAATGLPPEMEVTPANVRRFFEAYRDQKVGGLCNRFHCPLEYAMIYLGLTYPTVDAHYWTCEEVEGDIPLDPVLRRFINFVDVANTNWSDHTGQQCLDLLDRAATEVEANEVNP